MITIKWIIVMTYLVTQNPVTESPRECVLSPISGWTACLPAADPEPLVWESVTEHLVTKYDSLEACQHRVNEALKKWTALSREDQKKGLILECEEIQIK